MMPTMMPTAEQMGIFIFCAIALGTFGLQWRAARAAEQNQVREVQPQPLVVRAAQEMVTKEEYERWREEQERRMNRLDQEMRESVAAASESRKMIYQKIDSVRLELSEKMDSMPERVIAILRNTGAIGKV